MLVCLFTEPGEPWLHLGSEHPALGASVNDTFVLPESFPTGSLLQELPCSDQSLLPCPDPATTSPWASWGTVTGREVPQVSAAMLSVPCLYHTCTMSVSSLYHICAVSVPCLCQRAAQEPHGNIIPKSFLNT